MCRGPSLLRLAIHFIPKFSGGFLPVVVDDGDDDDVVVVVDGAASAFVSSTL